MARSRIRDTVENGLIRAVLSVALAVPYHLRVPMMGWIMSRLVAPLAGWPGRIEANLAHVRPDLPRSEVRRLMRAVPDNAGRCLIEMYSGQAFKDRQTDTALTGPGVQAFHRARAAGRPTILVTGHFGNYDAPRATLAAQGFALAGLYREMRNPLFNAHYVQAMSDIGTPVFPSNRRGLAGYVTHLKQGGMVGILLDVYAEPGLPVTFFGQVAPTASSVAQWARKYDAVVIPTYGLRQSNGLDFTIFMDTAVPPGDPMAVTQALNDSLEAIVRQHMDQWFWIHRRWKPERQRTLAAAKTGPGPSS